MPSWIGDLPFAVSLKEMDSGNFTQLIHFAKVIASFLLNA